MALLAVDVVVARVVGVVTGVELVVGVDITLVMGDDEELMMVVVKAGLLIITLVVGDDEELLPTVGDVVEEESVRVEENVFCVETAFVLTVYDGRYEAAVELVQGPLVDKDIKVETNNYFFFSFPTRTWLTLYDPRNGTSHLSFNSMAYSYIAAVPAWASLTWTGRHIVYSSLRGDYRFQSNVPVSRTDS